MRILGLAGRMGAGKDYVADYLATQYRTVIRVAFADALKDEVEALYGVDARTKPYPEHIRHLLQSWGVYRRKQDPEYWVDRTRREIEAREQAGALIVITDVRFPNEVDMVHELGGRVAFVASTFELRAERLGITKNELRKRSNHESEKLPIFIADFGILNDSDYREPDLSAVRPWLAGEVEPLP